MVIKGIKNSPLPNTVILSYIILICYFQKNMKNRCRPAHKITHTPRQALYAFIYVLGDLNTMRTKHSFPYWIDFRVFG